MSPRSLHRALAVALLVPLIASSSVLAIDGTDELLALLGRPRLDAQRSVRVENVQLDMGPGTLSIGSGILVPAAEISGHTLEMVFVGDARFRIDPSDPIEFAQLEMFAGEAPLVAEVTHAVLVAGDSSLVRSLIEAGTRTDGTDEALDEAEELFAEWAEGAQRKGFGVPKAIVKVVSEEAQASDYFAAWCRTNDVGDFYYSIDPFQAEQVTLGQFVPMDERTRDRIRRYNRRGRWFGRFADMDLLGHWDTWISTSLESSEGEPIRGVPGFEAEHYSLDVTVDPRYKLDTNGTAHVRARVVAPGRRTVDLELYSGFEVQAVRDGGGQPLPWIRSDAGLTVVLPKPVARGERLELQVDYQGSLIQKVETYEATRDKPFRLLSTGHWYPRVGALDRATYDVTLRTPDRFDLVGSGKLVDSGIDDAVRWQRRVLDIPAVAFTFEVGRFDVVHDRAGHVDLTFAFPRHRFAVEDETRQRIIDTTKRALLFFEERFGPYPMDTMTVAVVFRDFSQAYLSFLTLSEIAMMDPVSGREKSRPEWADEVRDLTIAHELSHQWWGNWVGWATYRDQWLSEALAEYSSLLFGAQDAESVARFMARNAVDWRRSIRRVESLGPVTLGYRLASSKGNGYQGIVYDKGSVVIRMLSRSLGDEPFAAMLGELARAVGNRVIDTETFLLALEKMSGYDLDEFADRFVYGIEIPDVFYRYDVEPNDGGQWILRGNAIQSPRGRTHYELRYATEGHWRITSEFESDREEPRLSWAVPFQIVITPPEKGGNKKKKTKDRYAETKSARGYGGQLLLEGAETEFEYVIPERPERMDIDQFGEVLARFYDEGLRPKSSLFLRASRYRRLGELETALTLLEQALAAPVYSERGMAWSRLAEELDEEDLEELGKREDSRIHALRARILIETGSFEQAREALQAAESLLEGPGRKSGWNERRILWSRLDLERGDYASAFERLNEKKTRWALGAEGYAILAAAAHEEGREKLVDDLIEKAERRGADVSELRAARAVRPNDD